jgi:hypothetical protein
MKHLPRAITRIYSILVLLYPRSFREKFSAEMIGVFGEALNEVTETRISFIQRLLGFIRMLFLELASMPANLMREYWLALSGKEMIMTRIAVSAGNTGVSPQPLWNEIQPSSWKEALVAGLPQALVTIAILMSGLLTLFSEGDSSGFLSPDVIPLYLFVLAGLVCLVFAWRAHFPRWSSAWYGYWLIIGFMLINGLVQLMGKPWRYFISDFMVFIVLMFLMAGLFWFVARRDRIQGILFALPVIWIFWMIQLEFVPNATRYFLQGGTGLLVTLGIVWIARHGNVRKAFWQTLLIIILIGVPYSYAGSYLIVLPPEVPLGCCEPSIGEVINNFLINFLLLSCMVVAPLLTWGIKRNSQQSGRLGKLGEKLVVAGLLLAILGCHGAARGYWLAIDYHLTGLMSTIQIVFNIIAYLGGVAWLMGTVLLVVTAENIPGRAVRTEMIILLALSPGIPLIIFLATHAGDRVIPASVPYNLSLLNYLPSSYLLVIGCAWIFFTIGFLTYWLTRKEIAPSPEHKLD